MVWCFKMHEFQLRPKLFQILLMVVCGVSTLSVESLWGNCLWNLTVYLYSSGDTQVFDFAVPTSHIINYTLGINLKNKSLTINNGTHDFNHQLCSVPSVDDVKPTLDDQTYCGSDQACHPCVNITARLANDTCVDIPMLSDIQVYENSCYRSMTGSNYKKGIHVTVYYNQQKRYATLNITGLLITRDFCNPDNQTEFENKIALAEDNHTVLMVTRVVHSNNVYDTNQGEHKGSSSETSEQNVKTILLGITIPVILLVVLIAIAIRVIIRRLRLKRRNNFDSRHNREDEKFINTPALSLGNSIRQNNDNVENSQIQTEDVQETHLNGISSSDIQTNLLNAQR